MTLGIDDWHFILFEQCKADKHLKEREREKPFGETDLKLFID